MNRTPMSRLLPVSVLVLILLIVAACGGAPAPTAADPAPAAATGQEISAAAATDDRADWPEVFRIGYFGGDDAEQVLRNNEPIRVYLEEQIGVPVEIFTGTSYSAVIEAMRANRVEAMVVGPFAYVLAVQEARAEALAVGVSTRADPPVYDPSLVPFYHGAIFTKKGNGIETIEDLRGRSFNFVDPASTSGHLVPKTFLLNRGLDPDNEMRTVFAGSHPTSVISVWNDGSDAGAATVNTLNNLANEGQIEFCNFPDGEINRIRTDDEIRDVFNSCPEGHMVIIGVSDPIPSTPFAVRGNLPESFKTRVREVLVNTADDPQFIADTSRWYVDPSEEMGLASLDQVYNPLRDIARLLNLDLRELAEDG